MSKFLHNLLLVAFMIYFAISQYVIKGYDKVNTNLLRANETILRGCIVAPFRPEENDTYR